MLTSLPAKTLSISGASALAPYSVELEQSLRVKKLSELKVKKRVNGEKGGKSRGPNHVVSCLVFDSLKQVLRANAQALTNANCKLQWHKVTVNKFIIYFRKSTQQKLIYNDFTFDLRSFVLV